MSTLQDQSHETATMAVDAVAIGERVRKDMGDLAGLAESIKAHGLLHPVVVTAEGLLIAGHRRLEAVKLLGWESVPVTVLEVADLLSAERDENAARKDFTPTEAVAIGRLIEERERPAAQKRKLEGSARGGSRAGPVEKTEPGCVREIAARAVGMGASKYDKAKAVVAAAEADPDRFGDLPERMDETGNVSGAHREMQRRESAPETKKPRHAIHGRTPYRKPNREIERALIALDGICDLLDTIPSEEVDASKASEWSASLKALASRLNRFARRINE